MDEGISSQRHQGKEVGFQERLGFGSDVVDRHETLTDVYTPGGIRFIPMQPLKVLQGFSGNLPPCWIYRLSSRGRTAPRRSCRSCGGSPCTAPEQRWQQQVTVRPRQAMAMSVQPKPGQASCVLGQTCSSCMLLGMETGGQFSDM